MKVSLVAAIVIFLSAPLGAQWLTYRTPGLPRLADGKPIWLRPRRARPKASRIFQACGRGSSPNMPKTSRRILSPARCAHGRKI